LAFLTVLRQFSFFIIAPPSFHRTAERLALHLRREAQRSGVRWKRVLGGSYGV